MNNWHPFITAFFQGRLNGAKVENIDITETDYGLEIHVTTEDKPSNVVVLHQEGNAFEISWREVAGYMVVLNNYVLKDKDFLKLFAKKRKEGSGSLTEELQKHNPGII